MIYLDNASTTKIDKKVAKAMGNYGNYGNPSSLHNLGEKAKESLENSREIIADSINASPDEIIFTSGGTEGNNLALKQNWKKIITTKVEHNSILNICNYLKENAKQIVYIDVDSEGFVDLKQLENSIEKDSLVSIIHGNNEIGTLQDIEKIGEICRQKGAIFHIDACQSYLKSEINVKKQNIDMITLNAHKIHGPKGIGALYVRKGIKIEPLIHGGGQEKKLRGGTENVSGIIGFAKAVEIFDKKDINKMEKLRDKTIKEILKIPKTRLNGSLKKRLCNNINISFSNIEGEALAGYLNLEGIGVSTGSACSSKSLEPSHVLRAIGLTPIEANSSIRISLSKYTNEKEISKLLKVLKLSVDKLRSFSPFK